MPTSQPQSFILSFRRLFHLLLTFTLLFSSFTVTTALPQRPTVASLLVHPVGAPVAKVAAEALVPPSQPVQALPLS